MKRLVILALVIGMSGAADVGAGTLGLEIYVDGVPYGGEELAIGTTVDVLVVQDAYDPMGSGGEITVTMSASGSSATDTTPSCGGPVAADDTSYCCWDWMFNAVGFYDNGGGTWYAWMSKVAALGGLGTPGVGTLCESPLPSVYLSTIEFSFEATETTNLVFGGMWDGLSYDGVVGGTVNVELCACYGDVSGPTGVPDGVVSTSDLAAIVEFLAPYDWTSPIYMVAIPLPSKWVCADVSGPSAVPDGYISTSDLAAIVGYLGPHSGTTPPYTAPCMSVP